MSFTVQDLVKNLIDEVERSQEILRELGEEQHIAELLDDIERDRERYYDNIDVIEEVTKGWDL